MSLFDRNQALSRRQAIERILGAAFAASFFPVLSDIRLTQSSKALDLTLWKPIQPHGQPILEAGTEWFAQRVQALSEGEIRIGLTSRKIDDPLAQARGGGCDLALTSPAYYWQRPLETALFSGLPGALDAQSRSRWLVSESGYSLWKKAYEPAGLVPLPFGCGGDEIAFYSRREISSPKDLLGATVASDRARSDWFRNAGMQPISPLNTRQMREWMAEGRLEISDSLAHSTHTLLIEKIAPSKRPTHYYLNSWIRSAPTFELVAGLQRWNELSEAHRALLLQASREANDRISGAFSAWEKESLAKIRKVAPELMVRELPREVNSLFSREVGPLWESFGNSTSLGREIVASMNSGRSGASRVG